MIDAPRSERATQQRVIDLFSGVGRSDSLGYRYLGDRSQHDNRAVEGPLLRANLEARGYTAAQISGAMNQLLAAADVTGVTLYQANLRTYQLLRYGASVKTDVSAQFETVRLIDWQHPEANDFALAEEVTLRGAHDRRPDLVLYVNGIALAVIELKRSSVEVADGIRQLVSNQDELFHRWFFATVQLVIAGNDAQGVRYGTVGTPEKYFVEWKAEHGAGGVDGQALGAILDAPLAHLCDKARLLDLIYTCVIFDGGQKKVPRPHQYFALKAAQTRLSQQQGGVIWHTQGSGKSILMVVLAKWVLEHDAQARILVITDRDELDRQIEGVMRNAGVVGPDAPSPRVTSRAEFERRLASPTGRLLCALIHKFDVGNPETPPPVHGRFYVFVDECHRTQGGAMHAQMKRWLTGAIFVGFTGTPLLRRDKKMTRDIFGTYIHTYKFHQGVADGVILDLKYEARDVPQQLSSPEAVDAWFEQKTRGLNDYQRAVLARRWATMNTLMSSAERKRRILASVIHDFAIRPRLSSGRGTAILVAASIYDACHYFRLLQETPLAGECGIITSFEPDAGKLATEPANGDERYKYDTYVNHVLPHGSSTGQYEEQTKYRFINEPASMKLLIVVSKLLTGFDAPSCTFIYLDNELRDHTLFQAICRTNRLDGDDKTYGQVVDFKELFKHVQDAISVYSSDELDDGDEADGDPSRRPGGPGDGADENNVHLKQWLDEGRRRLDDAREALHYLCDPVAPPKAVEQYLRYFCGDASVSGDLDRTEPLRVAFYKAVTTLVRAYGEIASDLEEAGYTAAEATSIRAEVERYAEMRAAVKRHAGEELDVKPFEADMRHLINTYIHAESAQGIGQLNGLTLTEHIVQSGINDTIARELNAAGSLSQQAVAEAIINNVRKTIIREQLTDPKYYERMSALLDDLIKRAREEAAEYAAWLRDAEDLAKKVVGRRDDDIPARLRGHGGATVVWRNLPSILEDDAATSEDLVDRALEIDRVVRSEAPADWRGDQAREAQVLNAIHPLTGHNRVATMALFELIKQQPGY